MTTNEIKFGRMTTMASEIFEPSTPEAGERAEALCQQLRKASALIEAAIDRKLAPHGLTARQYALLRALGSNPDVNQMALSQLTSIDRSTMTEMIARLVGRALIKRERNPHDARSYLVRLTEGAGQRLAEVQPLVSDVHLSVWRSLDPSFIDVLEKALKDLVGPLEMTEAN